ncbi:hypothetical protein DB88DRAFT_500986 [Papiliotrema laurentii]|jgi:hypothetical protein|uniref:Uncharacterized protein n=1 Tax=Papiliotrema laurentii TaxID=5418 RepID=A0AAD9CUF3_PAPLA|nr:hypothetical protein DB88DRAFT_500986 [Papiliotrema laurentii]
MRTSPSLTPDMELEKDFAFAPLPPINDSAQAPQAAPGQRPPGPNDVLGPLKELPGRWQGKGFNTIWRPNRVPGKPQQDFFLELNRTDETIQFDRIDGDIPNRGLLQPDITMFGVHYLQQIKDGNNGAGLHIEPGLWVTVPQTTNPPVQPTVCRMASIPHGTTVLAQGIAVAPESSGPKIDKVDITPFPVGQPQNRLQNFKDAMNIAIPNEFRSPSLQRKGVTQEMVTDPNSVLTAAIHGQNIVETTRLIVSSDSTDPVPGGGTSNTAFLKGSQAGGPNADAANVTSSFWIEKVKGENGKPDFLQLQYTQTVLLNFNTLSWPHVTVATLRKVA